MIFIRSLKGRIQFYYFTVLVTVVSLVAVLLIVHHQREQDRYSELLLTGGLNECRTALMPKIVPPGHRPRPRGFKGGQLGKPSFDGPPRPHLAEPPMDGKPPNRPPGPPPGLRLQGNGELPKHPYGGEFSEMEKSLLRAHKVIRYVGSHYTLQSTNNLKEKVANGWVGICYTPDGKINQSVGEGVGELNTEWFANPQDKYTFHLSQTHFLVYEKPMKGAGMGLLMGMPIELYQAGRTEYMWLVILGSTGSLVIALAIGGWLLGKALRPLKEVYQVSDQIAAGNLKERVDLPANASDELKELEGNLNDTFQKVEEMLVIQKGFSADVAHELRTPITGIMNQSMYALKNQANTKDRQQALEFVYEASLRMRGMTESLLELSRVGEITIERDFKTVQVHQVIMDAVGSVLASDMAKGIEIRDDLDEAVIEGAEDLIWQLVVNLLKNAIQYRGDSELIEVTLEQQPNQLLLRVTDFGVGMSKETAESVFERFYRSDDAKENHQHGAGLGLTICKRIAEAHNATISVESGLGKGTLVTVTFNK